MIKKGMGFDWGAAAVSTNIWTGVLVKDLLEYMGFDWGAAAVSTNIWTGVLVRDVLEYVGMKSAADGAKWVDFFGPAGEVPNGDTVYGASHHRHVMMDPTR